MKSVLTALLMGVPAVLQAAPLEDSYVAARDRYTATLDRLEKSGAPAARVLAREKPALADLEQRLRRIIGAHAFKGFSAAGRINLGTLVSGYGHGTLDGLRYSSQRDKAQVIVSTTGLLEGWLRAHRDWWGPDVPNVPQAADDALKSEAFYTQALDTDAAIFGYGELPVAKPATARFAFAMLAARSQDAVPRTPDEILLALVQDGRIAVASAAVKAKIDPLPACDAVARDYDGKVKGIEAAYAASDPKDDKLSEQAEKLREEKDVAFRRCFAERASHENFFADVTRQAQAFLDVVSTALSASKP